jgi:hypothetical protein
MYNPVLSHAFLDELEKVSGLPRFLATALEEGGSLAKKVSSPAVRDRVEMYSFGRAGKALKPSLNAGSDAATTQALTHVQNRASMGRGMKPNVAEGMSGLKGNMDAAGLAPQPNPTTGAVAGVRSRSGWESRAAGGLSFRNPNPSQAQQAYQSAAVAGRGAKTNALDAYYQGRGHAPTNSIKPGGPKMSRFLP